MATHALIRQVPTSFAQALSALPPEPPIDVALARKQHAAYVEALTSSGLTVLTVPSDERYPDCCFVEDTALVIGGRALLTRSGAPSRRGETEAVCEALAPFVEVQRMHEPATLDGGDCLRLGSRLYVGMSQRTNRAGVERLREVFGPPGIDVIPIGLSPSVLHLKCVCSPLADDRLLLVEGSVPASTFEGAHVVWVPEVEGYAANAVAVGNTVLLSEGFPRTREALEAAGFRTVALSTSELQKADGSLTCLSILFAAPRLAGRAG